MARYSVKQTTQFLGVTAPTLHRWTDSYAAFLSGDATMQTIGVGEREERKYTDSDIEVLWTVAALREDIGHKAIKERLREGIRLHPPYTPDDMPKEVTAPRSERKRLEALIEQQTAEIAHLKATVDAKDKRIIDLEARVNELRNTLRDLFQNKDE